MEDNKVIVVALSDYVLERFVIEPWIIRAVLFGQALHIYLALKYSGLRIKLLLLS